MMDNPNIDNSEYIPGGNVQIPTRPWPPPVSPPCYMPQDNKIPINKINLEGHSKNINWSQLPDMTGSRPGVDKYSITKYSIGEWQQNNAKILEGTPIVNADLLKRAIKNSLLQTHMVADKEFSDNTERLKDRSQDIYKWKAEVEYAIKAMGEEIIMMQETQRILKAALYILDIPESIARECLEIRSKRLEPDLVKDNAEDELLQELCLVSDIRSLLADAFENTENKMKNNKSAKEKLEFDWSDKVTSHNTDSINIILNNKSGTNMIVNGSVRIPESQSTPHSWAQYSKNNLNLAEVTRQESLNLRVAIEKLLLTTSKDLRIQNDRVNQFLNEKAACTGELLTRLQDELEKTLQKLADNEHLSSELNDSLARMEYSMKLAQTRLDNRNDIGRPNVEHCRDIPQSGLINEVKSLSDCIAILKERLYEANCVRCDLLRSRGELEYEIMVKKTSLFLDKERCLQVRSFFPSATKLSGHD